MYLSINVSMYHSNYVSKYQRTHLSINASKHQCIYLAASEVIYVLEMLTYRIENDSFFQQNNIYDIFTAVQSQLPERLLRLPGISQGKVRFGQVR